VVMRSKATRTILTVILYLMLASVIVSTFQSVWIGIADKAKYLSVFPRATGILFPATLLTSVLAGANCILIWQRRRWAVWLNLVIGVSSIAQIELVGGPRLNEAIVSVACATTTGLPLLLWKAEKQVER